MEEAGQFRSVFHAALHDDEGNRTQEFFSEERTFNHWDGGRTDEADEFNPWNIAVFVGDDQAVLVAARGDEYRLEWRNLAGETTRVVTRDFTAHQRTETELEELKYRNYSIVNGDVKYGQNNCVTYRIW